MLKTEILKWVAGRVRAGAEGFSAFQNFRVSALGLSHATQS